MRLGRSLYLVGLALAIVLPVRAFVAEPISIASASMEPTLGVGRVYLVDKLTLRLRRPERGEIVIFHSPVEAGRDVGKRVIAVAGDSVELRDKKVFVNGRELDEPYAVHKRAGERLLGDTQGPYAVPSGTLFVLGDNRDESEDSSVWKDAAGRPAPFLAVDQVVGLVRGFYL